MDRHPNEAQLQEFASGRSELEQSIMEHIANCKQCQEEVLGYQMMFLAIEKQEKPAFGFDVTQMVLSQMPKQKASKSFDGRFVFLIALFVFGITGLGAYLFAPSLSALFTGVSNLAFYLITITALMILVFQSIDLLKNYQRKINTIDFS